MDRISKALARFSKSERVWVKKMLSALRAGKLNELENLDIKKLKGRDDIFRIRKGSIRIIYRQINSRCLVVAVERRTDTKYDF